MTSNVTSLRRQLKEEALAMGAAYFGVANLAFAHQGKITYFEQTLVAEYSQAVSIGVPLDTAIVDGISDTSGRIAHRDYWHHVYQVISPFIDRITARLCPILKDKGYSAMPIAATKTLDYENHYGLFSHKMAANLAGLGWIGKSCMLITPDRGPRVRWGTILTNVPLEPGNMIKARCGRCTRCVEACPAGAFRGKDFDPSQPREMRMMAEKCSDFLVENIRMVGFAVCGRCVYICPWGQKASKQRILNNR
ncbi:MAG: 4Fe-4S double cluster binding domain-containing protein [Chloroflexota bacterium]